MIIIICIILGLIIGFIIEYHYQEKITLYCFSCAICIGIIGLISGFLINWVGNIVLDNGDYTKDFKQIELITLKDDNFIFSTHIDGDLYYYYFYENIENDIIVINKVNANNTFIKYDNTIFPHIKFWYKSSKNDFIDWLFFPIKIYSTIYLPEDSVIREVN